jgi:Cytochrome P450
MRGFIGEQSMATNSVVSPTLRIPPTLPGLHIFGNTFAFVNQGGLPVETFQAAAQTHGDIVRLRAVGRTIYLVSHPVLIQEILVKRVNDFHKPIVLRPTHETFGPQAKPWHYFLITVFVAIVAGLAVYGLYAQSGDAGTISFFDFSAHPGQLSYVVAYFLVGLPLTWTILKEGRGVPQQS